MNVTVVEAMPEHFEGIYPLLRSLNDKTLSKMEWNRLLTHPWGEGKPFGYALRAEDGTYVGFLGTVYSRREIDGETHDVCNLTSWVVDPAYRQHSLKLAFAALKDRQSTITAFTATKDVSPIWAKLGLQPMEPEYAIAYNWNPLAGIGSRWGAATEPEDIRGRLSPEEQRIFEDHAAYDCRHLVLFSKRNPERTCYLVFNATRIKGLPVAHLHYAGDRAVFAEAAPYALWRIGLRTGAPLTLVPRRFAPEGLRGALSVRYRFRPDKIFYRSARLQAEQLDNLYSELVLLNL